MKRFMLTLWELLGVAEADPPSPPPRQARPARATGGMQARYDQLVDEMKAHWGIRVHRWRSRTSGCAWELRDKSGRVDRLIESPYPKGPMSCAVFLHEVGHHAIGFNRYSPRCLEEYMAWDWALRVMNERGFNVTAAVLKRRDDAMRYALAKALRRGLKRVPEPLLPYLPENVRLKPAGRRRSRQPAG
ncbi:MAG: hypothetical protein MK116_11750 [Phycisphaerales bacterium]|nr:hypothetical protein [Phycisphaerales bacterium]